jgi:AmmeMemoRadiSam system protein B/AmmeMemoRadiSam system protein A
MREKVITFFFFALWLTSLGWPQDVRKAVWAGQFYDARPDMLAKHIDHMLQQAGESALPKDELKAIIVPHAGYVYSGPIAAYAYLLINNTYDTVVIIGTAHRHGFKGCSIYLQGGYQTPLGVAEIDAGLARQLSKATGFKYIPEAHRQEHSIEVQVPFIQKVLPRAKIVPVLMGIPSKKTISKLSNALARVLADKNVLVIASTDMSHFLSKDKAHTVDKETIALIQSQTISPLIRKLERRENIMCGGGGVVSVLLYAQAIGEAHVEILRYADSSAAGGPESQVVGYLSAAVYSRDSETSFSLSSEEKEELIQLAHSAITTYVKENKVINYTSQNPLFLTEKGAFVTLKMKGRLRGCIGFIEPIAPLYQTVIQAAIYAASKDVRFPPVSPKEIKDLEIEISVLSPLRKIKDPNLIQVGKHGLVIAKAGHKGLLLPQVPVEKRWSRKTFLQQICLKAGLPEDAWKADAEIYIFEAFIFH